VKQEVAWTVKHPGSFNGGVLSTAGGLGPAGLLRAKLLARKHRARLADTLIAQSCIDHEVRLVTRDADFRRFARLGGLRLAV
jgi:predicted nucleic acid-binding protein